jgi:hypothetical protein
MNGTSSMAPMPKIKSQPPVTTAKNNILGSMQKSLSQSLLPSAPKTISQPQRSPQPNNTLASENAIKSSFSDINKNKIYKPLKSLQSQKITMAKKIN